MSSNQLEVRQKIVNIYLQNCSSSISAIAKELKFPRTTVRDVLKKFISIGSIERKKGSGGNRSKIEKN